VREALERPWWGPLEFGSNGTRRCNVGPLVVWFEHLANGFVISWEALPKSPDEEYPDPSVETDLSSTPLLDRENVERFAFDTTGISLVLSPCLADRPVITSPKKPLYILPHTEATIFASSPLWLKAHVGSDVLFDRAVDRPSDTWFGPTTTRGEFCYATKAFCRLRLEDIQTPLHRAVTSITVNNRASSPIHVNRMKLPAPNLALYAQADGRLWTEDVTFNRTDEDEGFASLQVAHRSPRHAASPIRVSDPREGVTDDMVTRAFSSIFSWSSV
jgi:hypothetical protein